MRGCDTAVASLAPITATPVAVEDRRADGVGQVQPEALDGLGHGVVDDVDDDRLDRLAGGEGQRAGRWPT